MMADYNSMDAMFDRVVERRKENLREKRRKRNVAAIVDFASNLLVAAGNMNGARLKSPAPLLPEYEKAYSPMALSESGRVMVRRLRQSAKAYSSMARTSPGNCRVRRLSQS